MQVPAELSPLVQRVGWAGGSALIGWLGAVGTYASRQRELRRRLQRMERTQRVTLQVVVALANKQGVAAEHLPALAALATETEE